jgi:hypothetical protein
MSIQTQTRCPPRCSICKQPGHRRDKCAYEVKLVLKTSVATSDPPDVVTSVATSDPPEPVEPDTCPICMENLGKTNFCTTKCGHQFCLECMLKHTKTKKNCPLCRANLPGSGSVTLGRPEAARLGSPYPGETAARPLPVPSAIARDPYRTRQIQVDNVSSQTFDIWWLPSVLQGTGNPSVMHRNIRPNSTRIQNVAARGDRFLLANPGVIVNSSHLNQYPGFLMTYNSEPGNLEHYILTDDELVQVYDHL